jgi:phosphonate transport system substrate-binding protein
MMKRTLVVALIAIAAAAALAAQSGKGPLTVVWYPNQGGEDWKAGRQAMDDLITQATGRQVVDMLTTDYVIAIQAIANDKAAICYPGAVGYIQAEQMNKKVVPLVTVSSAKGTLDDSVYYSRVAVRTADAAQYFDAASGKYKLDPLKGKTYSFVSTSSTSGFMMPSSAILKPYFAKQMGYKASDKVEDLFLQGGSGMLFSNVVFGQTHQGSIYNVLSGKADACSVDDTDVDAYFDLVAGKANAPGAVYAVKQGAAAPFDTVPGTSFVVIASTTVRQAPIIANLNVLTQDEFKKIRALLTTDAVAKNPKVFTPKGYQVDGKDFKGIWAKSGDNRFLAVDAKWYDDIRQMMK